MAALPNTADRAGSFQPLSSMWTRFFGHSYISPIQPPAYDDIKVESLKSEETPFQNIPGTFQYEKEPGFLRKARKRSSGPRNNRGMVKFRPSHTGDLSSDSDSDGDNIKLRAPLGSPTTVHLRPWLVRRPSSSSRSTGTTTLFGDDSWGPQIGGAVNPVVVENEEAKLLAMPKVMYNAGDTEVPEYSDHEEDVTAEVQIPRNDPAWSPPFFLRHHVSQSRRSTEGSKGPEATGTLPPGAVPVTPSLINALDRIAVAQGQAYGSFLEDGLPEKLVERRLEGRGWDLFWKDVNNKARQSPR